VESWCTLVADTLPALLFMWVSPVLAVDQYRYWGSRRMLCERGSHAADWGCERTKSCGKYSDV